MNKEWLENAILLSQQLDYVLVATADSQGTPHMAAAEKLVRVSNESIVVTSWYCPASIRNLQENPGIAIVVWNPLTDTGYQLLGQIERVEDATIMDGWAPQVETHSQLVEVEKQLFVRVDKVLLFQYAAHSDMEE